MTKMTYTNSSGENSSGSDACSRFLKDRTIFIDQEINDDIANMVVAKLLFH
jgi:ATP-dependent protease ClpP protease subunit